MTRILVIDNYDSFVYTLNGYLLQLGAETDVLRNDAFPEGETASRIAEYDGVRRGSPFRSSPRRSNRGCRSSACVLVTRRSRRPSARRSPTRMS
jgi:hypothetical protein